MRDQANALATLSAAVERHSSRMTPTGEERMRRLLDDAAARLAAEPERADEAVSNLQRLLDQAAEESARRERGERRAVAAIDDSSVDAALRRVCPIFPIC